MAKDRLDLPKSELEIARIVWRMGEATVRQVFEALPKGRNLDFWTVQTYLRRLKDKGYLKTHRVGKGHVYSPAIQPKHVMCQLMDDFFDRVLDGEVIPLFQHLIESRGLTDDEIDHLQEHLDELKDQT